jgi:membrane protease YdiL (CAAX protease family)
MNSASGAKGVLHERPKQNQGWLQRFFLREDPTYDRYAATCQATSWAAKFFYLLMYLLPGILVYVAINVGSVYRAELGLTGVSGKNLQFGWVMLITFGWHMLTPFLFLRFADKLTFRQSLEFLGLNRIDLRGLFLVLPVYCVGFAIVALPYMHYVWNPFSAWLGTVPAFQIPAYSIFQGEPDGLYSFPPVALVFLFIGNFLGEELYFRGYLLKKTAFLGKAVWILNSLLFALYHFWQVPQTWPLLGLVLAFGLLMWLRKDLYVLIAFHLFVNMWLAFGAYRLEQLVHLAK